MSVAVTAGAALLHLLGAPSKQAVDEFLCACAREVEQLSGPGDARLAEIATTFGVSAGEAAQLQRAGVELVTEAVYRRTTTAEQVATLFADDFHADLRTLLARVLLHRLDEWRAESLAAGGASSMPKLERTHWQAYRKPAEGGGSVAAPTLQLSLGLGACAGSGPREVKVEMVQEQLEAMLTSMSKIKEQLDNV